MRAEFGIREGGFGIDLFGARGAVGFGQGGEVGGVGGGVCVEMQHPGEGAWWGLCDGEGVGWIHNLWVSGQCEVFFGVRRV